MLPALPVRRPAVISRQDNRGAAHGSFAFFLDNFSSGEDSVAADLSNSSADQDNSGANLKNSGTYEDNSGADLKNSGAYEDNSGAELKNLNAYEDNSAACDDTLSTSQDVRWLTWRTQPGEVTSADLCWGKGEPRKTASNSAALARLAPSQLMWRWTSKPMRSCASA